MKSNYILQNNSKKIWMATQWWISKLLLRLMFGKGTTIKIFSFVKENVYQSCTCIDSNINKLKPNRRIINTVGIFNISVQLHYFFANYIFLTHSVIKQ